MPEEDHKILKYNHGEKSMKVPFTGHAELESLLEKMNTCHNNPEKSSTTKEFECLGENTEEYITFSVPIKKETTKIDKNGTDTNKVY